MSTQPWKKHRLFVALVVLACALIDMAVLLALGAGMAWLLGVASPLLWAGLAVAAIVTARIIRLGRWVWNAHRLATFDAAAAKPALWSNAAVG